MIILDESKGKQCPLQSKPHSHPQNLMCCLYFFFFHILAQNIDCGKDRLVGVLRNNSSKWGVGRSKLYERVIMMCLFHLPSTVKKEMLNPFLFIV